MLNVYCTYFILKHFKPTCWNGINSYCWPVSRKLPWASLDTTKNAHIVRNTCSLKRQKWIGYFKELTNPIHKNWNTVEDIYAHKYLCTHAGRAQPSWPGGIGTESSSHTLYLTCNLQTHGRLSDTPPPETTHFSHKTDVESHCNSSAGMCFLRLQIVETSKGRKLSP